MLSFDVQTSNTWFGQMVVVTKGGIDARDRLKAQFETYLKKTFPGTDTLVKLLEVGPPVGLTGAVPDQRTRYRKLKRAFPEARRRGRKQPAPRNVVFDWMEPARVVKVEVDCRTRRASWASARKTSPGP